MSETLDRDNDDIRDAIAWARTAFSTAGIVIREAGAIVDVRDHKMLLIYLGNAAIEAAKLHEQLLRAKIAAERYREPDPNP